MDFEIREALRPSSAEKAKIHMPAAPRAPPLEVTACIEFQDLLLERIKYSTNSLPLGVS
jgi:hypothetical protein